MGVDNVALAFVAAAAPTGCPVRWDVADVEAVVDEELGEVASEAGGVLNTPTLDGAVVVHPRGGLDVAGHVVGEMLGADNGAALVEDGGGEAAAMRIDADDVSG